jgi:DNA modification methylase
MRKMEQLVMKNEPNVSFSDPNFAKNKKTPIHRWVPWIAGYSYEYVESAIDKYLVGKGKTILDPFCGVGTTLVSAIYEGHNAIGFEINPYAALASKTKAIANKLDIKAFDREIQNYKKYYSKKLEGNEAVGSAPIGFKTKGIFYSPRVLRKVLITKKFIDNIEDEKLREYFRLAFGSTMVQYSNYSYEPSLGQRKSSGKENIEDYDVGGTVVSKLEVMREDVIYVKALEKVTLIGEATVICDSFFNYKKYLKKNSIDLLLTSPPYLNNYHYIRNTRPQLYWLDYAEKPEDLKSLETGSFGKYWQTVRQGPQLELLFSTDDGSIEKVIEEIRATNNVNKSYGGPGWANYVVAYLNDCYRFAQGMKYCLKEDGIANIVIGNNVIQGVHVPTDVFFGKISELAGLTLVDIHIPRTKRIGNSIIRSDVRIGEVEKDVSLYEAIVELKAA